MLILFCRHRNKTLGSPRPSSVDEGAGAAVGPVCTQVCAGLPLVRAEVAPASDNRQEIAICSGNVSWTPLGGQPHRGAREAKKATSRPSHANLLGQWGGQPEKGETSTEMWPSGHVFPVTLHSFIGPFTNSPTRDADHIYACVLWLGGPLCELSPAEILYGLNYAP